MKKKDFTEAELEGRIKFCNFIKQRDKIKNIHFTESKFDKVDVITYDGSVSATTEIKNRFDYSSTNELVQKEGVVIEKNKFDYLLETVSTSGMGKCYYCMIFNDNIMYLFDISNLSSKDIKWKKKYFPKSTCGNNTKIIKEYTTLPLDWGLKFNI